MLLITKYYIFHGLTVMACRRLFRRSGFLFILIALWPLTHGYDGYHEASLVDSCAFGNDIAENKASNFASCPWNHNRLIIRIARGKVTSLRESTSTLVPSHVSIL